MKHLGELRNGIGAGTVVLNQLAFSFPHTPRKSPHFDIRNFSLFMAN